MTAASTQGRIAGLQVTEIGSGPLVVFCHGLFGQGKNWTSIAKQLNADYTCLLVDMPNHGRSAWTDHVSYPEMAAAVAQLIVDRAAGSSVAVVGHSMGGKVAMALALLRPQLVDRLCVVDIAPVRYSATSFADYVQGMRALDLTRLSSRTEAEQQLQRWVPDRGVRSFLLQNLRRDDNGWQWQMNLGLLGDRLPDLQDWPELDVEPYRGPVAWIAGAGSSYVTPENAAAVRRLFPRAVTITVKNAGHWVHSEQPEVFLSALRQFLRAR